MAAINADNLANEIMKALNEYRDYADETLAKDIEAAANLAKDEVKNKAPVHKGVYTNLDKRNRQPGTYKKSWKVKKDMKDPRRPAATVYASGGNYRLTHLLEHGHAKRNGGRVRGIEHIAPAEALAERKLEQDLARHLQGGG